MGKIAKRLLNGSVRSLMLLALVVLFAVGNASADNVKGTGGETHAGAQPSDPKDTTGEDGDWSDMGMDMAFDEICVAVTGITGEDLEFIMVPANVPGPGEKGYDSNTFFDKMVGDGELFKGEVFAYYFGTEAGLTDPGVKFSVLNTTSPLKQLPYPSRSS